MLEGMHHVAVIASEDNRFASHNGFDMIEIKKENEEQRKKHEARLRAFSRGEKF